MHNAVAVKQPATSRPQQQYFQSMNTDWLLATICAGQELIAGLSQPDRDCAGLIGSIKRDLPLPEPVAEHRFNVPTAWLNVDDLNHSRWLHRIQKLIRTSGFSAVPAFHENLRVQIRITGNQLVLN